MTFLAIDVGNTRLKWALYDRPHTQANVLAQGAEFLENIETLADGPWANLPAPDHMLGCVVAGDAVKRRRRTRRELPAELTIIPFKIIQNITYDSRFLAD